jgi:hypothetical protein
MIFAGVTGYRFFSGATIFDNFWLDLFPAFDIEYGHPMIDNYHEYDSFEEYLKHTNLEVWFSLGDKSFALHQGQTADFGEYKVDLLIAEDIEYQPKRLVMRNGDGSNGFSFLISKMIESGPSPAP